ncbi:hypothetical protein AB0K09_22390 [Streptomyces sp. NPDC049577]|uniref:hypothetical protein n=1 Tax=Streptomyces sp. NPDC049577 TaxID=3155153 RepID=UPI00343D6935
MGAPRRHRAGRGVWVWRGVRLLVLAAAVWGLLLCPSWVEQSYWATDVYRHAPACPAGRPAGGADCVEQAVAQVTDKKITQSCSTDSGGVEHCTDNFNVRISGPERARWLDVGEHTYRDARRGDRAGLRLWRGGVVRMVVRGHTETYLTSGETSLMWRLAGSWALLGLALAIVTGLRWVYLLLFAVGWAVLTLPFVAATYTLLFGWPDTLEWTVLAVLTAVGLGIPVVGSLRARHW